MFRIDILTDIARRHERGHAVEDPVELYLAYVVRLRGALGLTTVAPAMQFYPLSGLSQADLTAARDTVLAREREEFDDFLVLDYEPWQTLLRRQDPQAYAQRNRKRIGCWHRRSSSDCRKKSTSLGWMPPTAMRWKMRARTLVRRSCAVSGTKHWRR
ncbi:hypothetical protein CAL14_06240 [Bordetella genomosp. 9]|nr:hypothetical protein CAL14_06240 [Bordetella genomosp. 9]